MEMINLCQSLLLLPIFYGTMAYGSELETNSSGGQGRGLLGTSGPLEVIVKWKVVDYNFGAHTDRRQGFIQKNNIIASGMKLHGTRIFVCCPRFRPGVPATLSYIEYKGQHLVAPKLTPYPNWEMQTLGDCSAFQNVLSVEVDLFDRLWVLDAGRVNLLTPNPTNQCPPKLVIINLKTNLVMLTHVFGPNVASPTEAFLTDLVVACTSRNKCWVYISNAGQSILTVFNLEMNRSWSTQHPSMTPESSAINVTIKGINYPFTFGIDGIAMTSLGSKFDRVFYSPLSSYTFYSVSTKTLKEAISSGTRTLLDSNIRNEGTGVSQSDGIAMDNVGQLFYGQLNRNALGFVNVNSGDNIKEFQYAQSDKDLTWIDTFSFDNKGFLYLLSSKLNLYSVGTLDPTIYNFRIVRVWTGTKSYMHL